MYKTSSYSPACLNSINHPHQAAPESLSPIDADKTRRVLFWELFGADFMVDLGGATPKVVLIEINTSPALFRHGSVLDEMMPRMMEEVVQLCIDPYFGPPAGVEFDAAALLPKGRKFERVKLPDVPHPIRRSPSPFKAAALGAKLGAKLPTPSKRGGIM